MTPTRVVALLLLLSAVIAFAAYQMHTHHVVSVAAAPKVPLPENSDLRNLMQSQVHPEFTQLSFTIWHDQPLTPAKMDTIALSSSHIAGIAAQLDGYEAAYRRQGWSTQDVQFFTDKRLQLSRVALQLNQAARKHDEAQVISFFMHLDNTCQSCHKRFRPDLSWT